MLVKILLWVFVCAGAAIGGLGGADISLDHLLTTLDLLNSSRNEPGKKPVNWLMVD